MAVLTDSLLSFEFTFKEVDDVLWVKYEFFFRWDGESVFRDELLKRSPCGWAGRSPGALCANEFDEDSFLPVLREVLTSREPIYWQPTEPDVVIAFYPDRIFPLMPSRSQEIYVADHIVQEREDRRRRKEAHGGILPDDPITMIVFVDAYNWRDGAPYYGSGLGLIMRPQRKDLAVFYKELRREYRAFVTRERLEERIKERNAPYADEEKETGQIPMAGPVPSPTTDIRPSIANTIVPLQALPRSCGESGSSKDPDLLAEWRAEPRDYLKSEELSSPLAKKLALAAAQSKVVRIEYEAGSTPGRIRDIRPQAVFRVPGYEGLYLEALDIQKNEERSYRLDRLRWVEEISEPGAT
jgi:hypothetical protein